MKLNLILSDLRNCKEEFYEGSIIFSYTESLSNNDPNEVKTAYCSTGIFMKESGVNMKYWQGIYEIYNIKEFIDREYGYEESIEIINEARDKLHDRYNINFVKEYKHKISCPCELNVTYDKNEIHKICNDDINSFENLVYHINDFHATNFNEVADLIFEVSQKYDLETGNKLGEKLDN